MNQKPIRILILAQMMIQATLLTGDRQKAVSEFSFLPRINDGKSILQIPLSYTDFFKKFLRFTPTDQEDTKTFFLSLKKLSPEVLKSEITDISEDSLANLVKDYFLQAKNPLQIHDGKPINFREFVLIDVLNRQILDGGFINFESKTFPLTDELIQKGIDLYRTSNKIEHLQVGDADTLDKEKEELIATKNNFANQAYYSLTSYYYFRVMDNKKFSQYIIDNLRNGSISDLLSVEIPHSLDKIILLINLLAHLGEETDTRPYELVQEICMKIIKATQEPYNSVKAVWNKLFHQVMNMYSTLDNAQALQSGKYLILSYLDKDSTFPKSSKSYHLFLAQKYRLEGFKRELFDKNHKYPVMLQLYVLDVINTSLAFENELMHPDDLKYIFLNLHAITNKFEHSRLELLNNLKVLLIKSEEKLLNYFSLFNSLYNMILLSCHYQKSMFNFSFGGYEVGEDISKAYIFFDQYLDIVKRNDHTAILNLAYGQPNQTHFFINIDVNYPFFKLINLYYNQAIHNTITDSSFLTIDTNDKLINEFILQTDMYDFFQYLRALKFKNKGFSYSKLSNTKLQQDNLPVYDFKNYLRMPTGNIEDII